MKLKYIHNVPFILVVAFLLAGHRFECKIRLTSLWVLSLVMTKISMTSGWSTWNLLNNMKSILELAWAFPLQSQIYIKPCSLSFTTSSLILDPKPAWPKLALSPRWSNGIDISCSIMVNPIPKPFFTGVVAKWWLGIYGLATIESWYSMITRIRYYFKVIEYTQANWLAEGFLLSLAFPINQLQTSYLCSIKHHMLQIDSLQVELIYKIVLFFSNSSSHTRWQCFHLIFRSFQISRETLHSIVIEKVW